ncbi:MAG: ABC transporter permease [Oscillospiraceae bacterium]
MGKYILRRIIAILVVLWAVATLTYFTVHVTPGDTATAIIIERDGPEAVSEETLNFIRTKFDLDRPIIVQYFEWLGNIVRGNFGTSYKYDMPVKEMLRIRLPNTLRLGGIACLLSLIIALPLGILSALKHNKLFDHLSRIITLALSSFPGFWLAIMGIVLLSITLNWLPTSGMNTPNSIILPALTLSVGMTAATTRMLRSSMLDVLNQDYMLVARSKGLSRGKVILHHGFRNAIPPIITIIGLQIGHILGGAVVIENIFAWPGVGDLFINAINSKDLPMIEGCVILISFGYAFINLVVDLIYACIDPRVKYTGEA